jgi:hypothetical protein
MSDKPDKQVARSADQGSQCKEPDYPVEIHGQTPASLTEGKQRIRMGSIPPDTDQQGFHADLEEDILDWRLDETAISAASFSPIFERILASSATGALIIGFFDGVPFSPKWKGPEESIGTDETTIWLKI